MSAYQPWRKNRLMAFGLIGLSIAPPILAKTMSLPIFPSFIGTALLLILAWFQWQISKRREFGKSFELKAIEQAVRAFASSPNIRCQPNYQPRGGEDIDLMFTVNGQRVPVEVKSFIRWNTYFWRFHGARERKAAAQSKRQARMVGARTSIIWLPQGR